MNNSYPPLESECVYHIYNRGINGETLFKQERNYRYFLEKYAHYLSEVLDTYAYCLLGNHFHFLVRVKSEEERTQFHRQKQENFVVKPSQQFAHFFNSYTHSINKQSGRTGNLFEKPFHRKKITSDSYFTTMIDYIHKNPVKHGFTDDFRGYPYSSYESHLSNKPTKLARKEVHDWFGNAIEFQKFHQEAHNWKSIEEFIIEFD